MLNQLTQRDIKIDVLELVQSLFEQPQFTRDLIALMDADLRQPMTALADALECVDQTAAQTALDALSAKLGGE